MPPSHVPSVRTPFRPADHGFPFPNCFPPGRPVWTVRAPFVRIPIGDASKGLCGGMVFAARDYQLRGLTVPRDPDAAGLYPYLGRRLWDSFNLPWTVLRLYRWMSRPDRVPTGSGTAGVASLTARREWPRVRDSLDRGDPAPLMLVKAVSRNPWALGLNHQVLAVGYDEDAASGEVTLHLYDPNYPICGPGDEGVTLRFNPAGDEGRRMVHSREGDSVRGFFLNRYTPMRPPAWG